MVAANGEELAAHNGQAGNPTIFIRPQDRRLHDPDVAFEEYHYYALRTRAEEKTLAPSDSEKTNWQRLLLGRTANTAQEPESGSSSPSGEKRRSSKNVKSRRPGKPTRNYR